ncbi:MAG: hypothetical protein M1834_000948 [Cirrosporium novae-zelandiae]|nr:MAG: hypothetical protein M1834_000948 [Cirrosporium novae-zelandiae]
MSSSPAYQTLAPIISKTLSVSHGANREKHLDDCERFAPQTDHFLSNEKDLNAVVTARARTDTTSDETTINKNRLRTEQEYLTENKDWIIRGILNKRIYKGRFSQVEYLIDWCPTWVDISDIQFKSKASCSVWTTWGSAYIYDVRSSANGEVKCFLEWASSWVRAELVNAPKLVSQCENRLIREKSRWKRVERLIHSVSHSRKRLLGKTGTRTTKRRKI